MGNSGSGIMSTDGDIGGTSHDCSTGNYGWANPNAKVFQPLNCSMGNLGPSSYSSYFGWDCNSVCGYLPIGCIDFPLSDFDNTPLYGSVVVSVNGDISVDGDGLVCRDVPVFDAEVSASSGLLLNDSMGVFSSYRDLPVVGPKVELADWSFDDWIRIHNEIIDSGVPNAFGKRIPIPTSINVSWLNDRLVDFEDRQIIQFLQFGWPVGAVGEVQLTQDKFPRNHNSALQFPEHIDKFIRKGLSSHSMIGPFNCNPFNCPIGVSPLGTVEKSDSTDRRVILDMSWPKSGSINDLIPKKEFLGEKCELRYPGVDDLVKIVKSKGKGCALFKRDLKSAYRQLLRVDPSDIHLLGFSWKGKLYFDLTQPQGSRSAAMQCQRTSTALNFIYANHAVGYSLVNYLDDFGSAECWDVAEAAYLFLGQLLENAGILEAFAKMCGPNTTMVFLGVGFDTERMILFITPERLLAVKDELELWRHKIKATKKEVQSIVGILNFVAACVPASRIFLSRMFAQLKSTANVGSSYLSRGFKLDITWWCRFISVYNGVSMMLTEEWSAPDAIISTDACLVGGGGWFGSHRAYFHTKFPDSIKSQFNSKHHIAQLEMLTVVLACKVWGHLLSGKRILILCDNEASVVAINQQRAHNDFLQACSRELAFVCATHEFQLRSRHIKGVDNRIPDFLSRWDLSDSYINKFFLEIGSGASYEYQIKDSLFEFCADW